MNKQLELLQQELSTCKIKVYKVVLHECMNVDDCGLPYICYSMHSLVSHIRF